MPIILGVNFGREFFVCGGGGLKSWKNKAEKSADKFRHQDSLRDSLAIFLIFAGPK